MNNDLSFWRKLLLDITSEPKTDADIAYVYRNIARPNIPVGALWDAENGAKKRFETTGLDYLSMDDIRKMAIKNRGLGINQANADIPEKSPTGRIMQELMGDDYLFVPKKQDMDDFWSY